MYTLVLVCNLDECDLRYERTSDSNICNLIFVQAALNSHYLFCLLRTQQNNVPNLEGKLSLCTSPLIKCIEQQIEDLMIGIRKIKLRFMELASTRTNFSVTFHMQHWEKILSILSIPPRNRSKQQTLPLKKSPLPFCCQIYSFSIINVC